MKKIVECDKNKSTILYSTFLQERAPYKYLLVQVQHTAVCPVLVARFTSEVLVLVTCRVPSYKHKDAWMMIKSKEWSAAANIRHAGMNKQNKSTSTCKQPDAMVSHKSRKRRRQCRTKTSIVPLGVIKEDAEFLSEAIPSSLGVLQVVSVGMDDAVIME